MVPLPHGTPPIPHDITRVTEAELRDDLATFLNCVAYAEDELVVMRDGQAIAAVISMEGWRALRRVAEVPHNAQLSVLYFEFPGL